MYKIIQDYCFPPLVFALQFLPVLKMVEPYIHVYGAGHRVALSSSTRSDRVYHTVSMPESQILPVTHCKHVIAGWSSCSRWE